jgi:hypothetical protein
MCILNTENIVQYFPPSRITGFLEVYEKLMYCLIVLPFFLLYLLNAIISDQQLLCYVKTHTANPQ